MKKSQVVDKLTPIQVKKSIVVRKSLLHRNSCMSALRMIVMSTLGQGMKAKYDFEGANIKAVLRTATGCADEESCAKVSIAVVQNTSGDTSHVNIDSTFTMLENMIVNELNAAMQMNNSKPYSSKKNSKNDSIEQTEIEMYVFEILNLILSLLPNASALNIVLRKSVIESLFEYLDKCSFPIRRCIYRIIRISFCDARCNEELFGMKKKKCFVNQLLFKIGTFYLECSGTNVWGETAKNKDNNQKVKYGSIPSTGIAAAGIGDFSSNICCEEVCLLRTLQRNVLWSEIINEEIESSLKSNSPLELVAGTFALLGGHFESIRVGGRVKLLSHESAHSTVSPTASGLVVHVNKVNGTALVAFNVSIDLIPENVKLEDLISIDEVSPHTELESRNYNAILEGVKRFMANEKCKVDKTYADTLLQCMAAKCFQHLVQSVSIFDASLDLFPALLDKAAKQMDLTSFIERPFFGK